MRRYKFLSAFLIFWFIFLCLLHYFSFRPIWLDENFILENIKTLSIPQLLGPLKNSQSFPRIYLIAIKLFSEKFDYTQLSLRFFPLVSMLLAFFVWVKVYRKQISSQATHLLVLAALGCSYYFPYYAAELKQYSMDVLVVGLFCLYFLFQKQIKPDKISKWFVFSTLSLPFTIVLSQASFFVFWIVIYNFLFIAKKNYKIWLLLSVYSLVSILALRFVILSDIRHTLSSQSLLSYWEGSFVCTDSFYCFMKSFSEGLRKLSVWWFGKTDFLKRAASFVIPFFTFSIFAYGVSSLKKNKLRLFDLDSLGLVIFLELLVLAIMKKYPFTGERITLFFAPFVLYFIAKGIVSLKRAKFLYWFFLISYIGLLIVCATDSFLTYLQIYSPN